MDFILNHKITIMRIFGSLMLVIGFATHFWVTPKEGLSENDKASARIARMEAKVKGNNSSSSNKPKKKDSSKFLDKLKQTQEEQVKYLTIIAMILGVGFLGYSFINKNE